MATYAQIAQQSWTRNREYGSTIEVQLTFEEKDGAAADLNIPLIQDIKAKKGNRSDEPDKPIKVDELTLQLKDEQWAGTLINKLDGAGYRQLRVTVYDVTNDYEIFQGYVVGDKTTFGLYENVQSLKVKATGQLADLDATGAADFKRSIAEMADDIGSSLDIDRELDVYTSMRHDTKAIGDPLPNELRGNLKMMAGNQDDANLLQAAKGLSAVLGWQIFQENGRITFAEMYERAFNPQAVNKYESDGAGGFTQKTEDQLVTLDESNVIRRGNKNKKPEFKGTRPIQKRTQQFNLITRTDFSFHTVNDETIFGWGGSKTYTPASGLIRAGDILKVRAWGFIYPVTPVDNDVRYDAKPLEFHLVNKSGGADLWFDWANDEWVETQTKLVQQNVTWLSGGSENSNTWSIGSQDEILTLPEVPEGFTGELEITHHFAGDSFDFGAPEDLDHSEVEEILISHEAADQDSPEMYHLFNAISNEGVGQVKTRSFYLADSDLYSNQQAFEYWDGSQWQKTELWIDANGNDDMMTVTARRLGKVIVGDGKKFNVDVRDKERLNMLKVFRIKDNKGNNRTCLPLEITFHVLKGFYRIRLIEVMDQLGNENDSYSTEAQGDTEPGGSSTGGGGDGPSGTSKHGDLIGLDNPDDHLWALQVDFSNADYDSADLAAVRSGLEVYSKTEADDKFVEDANFDVQGTANQVIVDNPNDNVFVLSTPQDIDPTATPNFAQIVHGNAPSQDSHAVRAGKTINTSDPLDGGDKLLNLIDLKLKYNTTNLKITNGQLNTIQNIHEDANMLLNSLTLKEGLTFDDLLGYLTSETFAGGFGGAGSELRKVNGNWQLTVDDLIVRRLARFYEIAVERIRWNAGTVAIGPGGEKVTGVQENDSFYDTVIGNSQEVIGNSQKYLVRNWTCEIEEDKLISMTDDDLLRRQEWNGRGTGVTEATVLETETGDPDPENNSTPRSFTISIEDGSQVPAVGPEYAVIGNKTDPQRQNCIIITASDAGNPYRRILAGVDSHDKFGDTETIMGQDGRLDNLNLSHLFPELDGSQTNEFGAVWPNGNFYVNDGHFRGRVEITDPDASNAATKNYVDDAVGQGEGSVTIRSDTEPTERESGAGLAKGDIWIDTDDGDKPYTWDGSQWIRAYTIIDGGDIETGTITLQKLSFQENGRITGQYLKVDSDTEFTEDVIIRGTLQSVDGDFSGNVTATAGEIANWLLNYDEQNDIGELRATGPNGEEVAFISGPRPELLMVAADGEILHIGGDFSFDGEEDESLNGSSWNPTLPSSESVSGGSSDSDTHTYDVSSFTDRFLRLSMSCQVSASAPTEGDQSSANASLTFRFKDSGGSTIKSYSTTIDAVAQADSSAGDTDSDSDAIAVSESIPSNTVNIEIEWSISTSVSGGSASAEVKFGDPVGVIIGEQEFLSPLGMQMTNQGSSQTQPERIRLERNTGKMLGHEVIVEGPNGEQARLVISGGTLELQDVHGGNAVRDSWSITAP